MAHHIWKNSFYIYPCKIGSHNSTQEASRKYFTVGEITYSVHSTQTQHK